MTVFVIAMESEAEPIIRNLEKVKRTIYCDKQVIFGKLLKKKVAVVICGVGKVNAAAGAQYAVDCLKADKIVNVGVAGGLNDKLKVGEIYCISQAVQYDFDLVQLNGTEIGTLNEFTYNYLPLEKVRTYPLMKLATGDRFNDDKQDFKLLTEKLNADIRDMEGAAIAQVCIHAKLPFYSFKAISDLAGSGSTTEQFLNNLQLCASKLEEKTKSIFEAVNG